MFILQRLGCGPLFKGQCCRLPFYRHISYTNYPPMKRYTCPNLISECCLFLDCNHNKKIFSKTIKLIKRFKLKRYDHLTQIKKEKRLSMPHMIFIKNIKSIVLNDPLIIVGAEKHISNLYLQTKLDS